MCLNGICRFLLIAFGTPSVLNMKKDDVMYCYLPMYHTSGQMIMCPAFVNGNTTIIRKKFSASAFWKDCVKYEVTVRQ